MEKMKFRSGTSVTTILLILMTVTLTVVSVLALASARQDGKLTERNAEMTVRYYEARSEAVKQAAALVADGAEGEQSFTVDAGADRSLDVVCEIADGAAKITSARLIDEAEYDAGEDFFD